MIPFSNAADYVRELPRATLAALPGLGHVPFEEPPDQSLKPVAAFLLIVNQPMTRFQGGRGEINQSR